MSLKDHIRVMVVDDMSASRGLMEQALEQIGIRTTVFCKTGEEALKQIVGQPVHLVISDYNMPGMDGLTLLKKLREHKQVMRVAFILVTGTKDPTLLAKGREYGLNNLLFKPYTVDTLKTSIQQVVGAL